MSQPSGKNTTPNKELRIRVTEDEEQLLFRYREHKVLLEKECLSAGIDPKDVKHYWYKSKLFSIFAKNKDKTIDKLKEEILQRMSSHTPVYKTIKREKIKDAHCLVLDPCDIHIGKLASQIETGDEYNNNIAIKRVKEGIDVLIGRALHYNLDKIVLIIGNDILHTDTPKRTTTSGTPQDTDGQWYDNFLLAQKLYVEIIDKLISVADVHIMHNPSNHDYMSGWFLAQSISSWYRNAKNVTLDVTMSHRKAFVYHENLIGTTHGDGAKQNDLPLLMAQEFKKEWANTTHRYIHTAHVHHKTSKDYIGVTVESSRSASGTDSWHHRNGYTGQTKAIESYLYHPHKGQIARFSHIF